MGNDDFTRKTRVFFLEVWASRPQVIPSQWFVRSQGNLWKWPKWRQNDGVFGQELGGNVRFCRGLSFVANIKVFVSKTYHPQRNALKKAGSVCLPESWMEYRQQKPSAAWPARLSVGGLGLLGDAWSGCFPWIERDSLLGCLLFKLLAQMAESKF
jgi:hypothetical protein